MKITKPMLEYLASCSSASLESFELARLNDKANLRKQMIEVLDQWVEVDVQARVANWILARRRQQSTEPSSSRRKNSAQLAMPELAAAVGNCESDLTAVVGNAVLPLSEKNSADAPSLAIRRRCGSKPLAKNRPRSVNERLALQATARVA